MVTVSQILAILGCFSTIIPRAQCYSGTLGRSPITTAPTINNLPKNVNIQDSDVGGYVISNIYCLNSNNNLSPTMATFSLLQVDPSPPSPPFTFNAANGQVYLNANPKLNFQMVNMYTLTIQCSDNGGSDIEQLTVTVRPAPYFTNLPATVSIPETEPFVYGGPCSPCLQAVFFTVQATDIANPPSSFSFKLAPSANTNWFQISIPNSGDVSTTNYVDYEVQRVYYLAVIVYADDPANPAYGFERTGTLTISITDVCWPPQFQATPYAAVNVRQDVTAGGVFLTPSVYVEEKDPINFSILSILPWSPTNNNLFTIALTTGQLSYISNPGFDVNTQSWYAITIQVQDRCGSSTVTVTVSICDTVAPAFNLNTASATIVEQQNVGTAVPVYWITTVDSYSAGYMQYTISCCAPWNQYFAIDTNNDHILVAQQIDYATVVQTNPSGIFTLTIKATAATCLNLFDTLQITITVTEIQKPPVFNPVQDVVNINEQNPIGYPVPYTFTATDVNVGNTITYGYVSALYSNLFNFVNSVGNPHLECAIVFDYDTMPVHQYIFTINAIDNTGLTGTFTLTINILPVNQPPVFSPDAQTVHIAENLAIGTSVNYIFTVSDPDIGDKYGLTLVTSSFSSDFTLATTPVPYLQTAVVFDYEAMNPTTFQIQVKAADKAGLFDIFTMTVIIDNINEAPVFSPSTGTCNMNDMQPIGVSVCMNFFATDPDGDSITYAFQPNQFQSYFTLITTPIPHLTTAIVMNCFNLPTTSFVFTFTAMDPGGLYGTFTLTITVKCINQQPFFNPNTGVVTIAEQQAIGTSVPYVFQATDYNSGDVLTYTLQPSAYSTDFTFDPNPQPHLLTAKVFVYSTMASPSVDVYIRAKDGAGLFDTFTLTVMITPVNQPPTFSPASCNVNIPEGQAIGTSVPCTFQATAGSSSSLVYSVNSSPYSSYFTLITTPIPHLNTATVFAYKALTVTSFTFTITCTDGNGLTATFTEIIQITPVQHAPTFTPSSGAVSIPESQAVGSTVPVYFTATDPEGDTMTYALVASAYSIYFNLNKSPTPHLETATVLTLASLPQSVFNVYVTATNPSGLSATFTMTITVTAVNKAPVFSPTSCTANVNELQPVGTTAPCFFIATDPEGGSVTYTIAPNPYSTYFTLVMSPASHFETTIIFNYYTLATTTFTFLITATDNGGATATYTLTINVKPINRPPVFSPKTCSTNFNDNQAIGTTVPCFFSATVSTPGDSVTYSLNAAPYSSYFNLVPTGTPCLTVAQVMTYEAVAPTTVFTFTITATNTAGMTDTFTEIISLVQTKKAPVFSPTTCSASLGEGQAIGTTVYCFFQATSVDGTTLTYSIVPSTYSADFNLVLYPQPHLESNYVFVYKSLPSKSFPIQIMATTSAGLTATFTATITILQVVGPPIFLPTSAVISINEGIPIGSVVPYYFSASDNQGDAMTYTLLSAPYSSYFTLISSPLPHLETTTVIRYNSLLITSFSFTIMATAANSGMTGTFGLTINILQVNVPPVFNVTKGVASVYEGSPVGTPVPFGFTASDPNVEAVGFTIGSTLGSANEWALKPNPAIHLTVNSVMDFDDPFLVNPDIIVIVAFDAHGATTSCSVTISILPIYKNPPTFLAAQFTASLPQDAAVGTSAINATYKQNNGDQTNLPVNFAMYSTAGNGDTYFSIGTTTGNIKSIKPLTYPMPTMVFNVTMWYPSYPRLAASTMASISVTFVPGPSVNVTFSPNFYNFEIRSDANVNDYIGQVYATLTSFALNPVIYTMDTDSTYATIDSATGILSSVSGMTRYQEYIETVLATSLSASSTKPVYATFRLDTYNAAECLVDFQISIKPTSVTAFMLVSFVSSLQNTLQTQYPDAWPRLVYINRARVSLTGQLVTSQTPLSEPYTNVTVVVLKGTYSSDPAKVNQAKQYYKVPDVLGATLDSNANPGTTMRSLTLSSFSVTTVRPFVYTSVKKTTVTNWWLETATGNVIIGVLSALGLTLLLLIAAIPAVYARPMDFCVKESPAKPMGRRRDSKSRINNEFEFRYQPNDPARAFQRYDPSAVRNSKPPSRADMVVSPAKAMTTVPTPIPWRESNSSMTAPANFDLPDVDDVGYHSRPDSKLSSDGISVHMRGDTPHQSYIRGESPFMHSPARANSIQVAPSRTGNTPGLFGTPPAPTYNRYGNLF